MAIQKIEYQNKEGINTISSPRSGMPSVTSSENSLAKMQFVFAEKKNKQF